VADKLAWFRAHYTPLLPADVVDRNVSSLESGPLVGTPEKIVEELAKLRKIGMTYAIGYFVDAAYDPRSIDLFATKVIPELADNDCSAPVATVHARVSAGEGSGCRGRLEYRRSGARGHGVHAGLGLAPRDTFVAGRAAIVEFLRSKWARELDYALRK